MTARRWLVGWIVVFTGLVALGLYQNRHLAEQGEEARDALCALKADLERRVVTSEQFLRDHPKGIPGIPASVLVQSIKNQRLTLDSLAGLSCGQEEA